MYFKRALYAKLGHDLTILCPVECLHVLHDLHCDGGNDMSLLKPMEEACPPVRSKLLQALPPRHGHVVDLASHCFMGTCRH